MVFFIFIFFIVEYIIIYCDENYLFILYLDMDDFTKKWLLNIGFKHLISTFEGKFFYNNRFLNNL